VAVVNETHRGAGATPARPPIAGTDGLIASVPGVALGILTADCASVYLVDRVNRAVGLVHAGWRGTSALIVSKAVDMMCSEFGTDPRRLVVAIGPSIGACCYAVREDVRAAFTTAAPSLAAAFERRDDSRWQLDLKRANRMIAEHKGVPPEAIHVSNICTACDRRLFSYRRDGPTTGRSLQFIAIRV